MVASARQKTQLNVRVSEETRRLADLAATCEGRPLSDVVSDAVRQYVRSHSDGYRAYFDVAQRFLDAPGGSEEEAVSRAELGAGILRQRGVDPDDLAGDAVSVLARLRRETSAS
jgi:hypothetical protein